MFAYYFKVVTFQIRLELSDHPVKHSFSVVEWIFSAPNAGLARVGDYFFAVFGVLGQYCSDGRWRLFVG